MLHEKFFPQTHLLYILSIMNDSSIGYVLRNLVSYQSRGCPAILAQKQAPFLKLGQTSQPLVHLKLNCFIITERLDVQ